MAQPARSVDLRDPIWRYRIMAWIVGTMLIFVYLFFHLGHTSLVGYKTSTKVEDVIGPIHGALYIVYLGTVAQLWIQLKLRPTMVILMVAAGWLPFTAFIAERWFVRQVVSQPAPA